MAQKKLITMTPKELSRYEVIKRLLKKEINGTQVAKQIGLCVRQVKNIKARVIKEGVKGVINKNRGKPGNRRMSKAKIDKIKLIVKKKYYDFGPTFAAEKLDECHGIEISNEKLRRLMTKWNLWKPKPRKKNKEYRSWRQRKEYYGEMIQFDGSYHNWLEQRDGIIESCLLASIDDATGKITRLRFVHDEGTIPVFTFWKEYVEKHGKPSSIYLDRHSTYKQNQKSVFDDPNCLTQFQRAMERDLDIRIIHAYSPQAKGRAERLFKTLQDRLIKEMRLAGVSTIKEANKFVKENFIPKFNAKFSVLPQKKGNLHKSLTKFETAHLDKIFSIYNTRVVNNDFTIRFKGKYFQLSKTQPILVLRKVGVQIEERINGQIFISLRNKYLNYTLLPARPEKIKTKIIAKGKIRYSWKPPADHPWRRGFIDSKKKVKQTVSVN
ncbi:ISNCY family transposase [Patescibacteria group bacterium]|nr:ISNCY family transposase [Patescibacteria group bacterium]